MTTPHAHPNLFPHLPFPEPQDLAEQGTSTAKDPFRYIPYLLPGPTDRTDEDRRNVAEFKRLRRVYLELQGSRPAALAANREAQLRDGQKLEDVARKLLYAALEKDSVEYIEEFVHTDQEDLKALESSFQVRAEQLEDAIQDAEDRGVAEQQLNCTTANIRRCQARVMQLGFVRETLCKAQKQPTPAPVNFEHAPHPALATGECVPTAQVASQQGRYLARVFQKLQKKESLLGELKQAKTAQADPAKLDSLANAVIRASNIPPFHYSHQGSLAYIGSDKAIADLPVFKGNLATAGFATYYFWRSACISQLFSLRNRLLVATDRVKTKTLGRDVSRA
ncbi:hypothetical protein JCM10207_008054 [Rhodosporidiobolus poonsookiae]